MPVTPRISALVEPDRKSLAPSALAAPANATAAPHSAAPRITFFIMPPLFSRSQMMSPSWSAQQVTTLSNISGLASGRAELSQVRLRLCSKTNNSPNKQLAAYWQRRRCNDPKITYEQQQRLVRGTGIEPATSSVSGKRSPAELTAPGSKNWRWRRESNPCARLCRPLPHHSATPPRGFDTTCNPRADDGIRTRDPHLGKVMRYQLRYIRAHRARSSPGAKHDDSPIERACTTSSARSGA